MATIRCIEDIEVWQKARVLVQSVYNLTRKDSFREDFFLRNQVRKTAVSILSNIAEGFERNGNKEFLQFLSIAKGSTGELKSQLYIALDMNYIRPDEFQSTSIQIQETGRMIYGLMKYLRESGLRGSKYPVRRSDAA